MKTLTTLNICGVPTSVVSWGKGVVEVNNSNDPQDVVLMIPGNPGYVPLYEDFLEEIYNRLGIPVWIIGHAGHEPETKFSKFPPLAGNETLYDTNGQTIHKQRFIETYVPKNVRLHLIGHSIGPYIIMQLLKIPSIQEKVIGSYFIFPTIEKMAESPKGKAFVAFIKFQWLVLLFLQIIYALIPRIFLSIIFGFLFLISGIPQRYREMYLTIFDPTVLRRVFSMANHEMAYVKERDTETLKANKDKLKLFYGSNDGWTPKSYYTDVQRDVPGIDVEIGSGYKHGFVLKRSKDVGKLVAGWILKRQQ